MHIPDKEVARLVALSEAELLREIGSSTIEADSRGFGPLKSDPIGIGHRWFERRRDKILAVICKAENKQKILDMLGRKDEAAAALAIADLITAFCGVIPPVVVACLVIRVALVRSCP